MNAPLLFVAALDWEAEQVVRQIASPAVSASGAARLWRGRRGEREIAVLRSGIGSERAVAALAWAAPAVRPAVVLSTGCGGGLADPLATGDVVVADEVVSGDGSCWPTSAGWRARYARAAERAGARVFAGRLLTSAEVLAGPGGKRAAAERARALAVDMEGAALAERAARLGVEFAAARVILDPVTASIPGELLPAVDESGRPSLRRLLSLILRRPGVAFDLWTLGAAAAACRKVLFAIHRDFLSSLEREPPARDHGLP